MKFATTFLLVSSSLATTAHGFLVIPTPGNGMVLNAEVENEVDFDAPSTRAVAVGNAVHSPKKSLFDALPKFLADAFGIVATGEVVTDGNFIMDEECYLGKGGNLDECVDFDPTHSSP